MLGAHSGQGAGDLLIRRKKELSVWFGPRIKSLTLLNVGTSRVELTMNVFHIKSHTNRNIKWINTDLWTCGDNNDSLWITCQIKSILVPLVGELLAEQNKDLQKNYIKTA